MGRVAEIDLRGVVMFATKKHHGQVDKAGLEYISHPFRVSCSNRVTTKRATILALLHDTVEDTDATIEEIENTFGISIASGVSLLTRGKEQTYDEYIKGIKESGDNDVIEVKLADLADNMDLTRLPEVTEKDLERTEKYEKYHAELLHVLRHI